MILEKDRLFDIAKFAAEYQDDLMTKDPNLKPELARQASLEQASQRFNVDVDDIHLSLEHHNSVNDPNMAPYIDKLQTTVEDDMVTYFAPLVKAKSVL
jgi:hypothetical protein